MCEFCIKHGEGKKWYEVVTNYSEELLNTGGRRAHIIHFNLNFEREYSGILELADRFSRYPLIYYFIQSIAQRRQKKIHYGQVVPLEEAEKIIDFAGTVTRLPCVCRKTTTGNKNARYCFGLGATVPTGNPEIDAGLEALTGEEAKEAIRKYDREGMVHSIWTFNTPYIGGLCNCDHDCLAYRAQITKGLIKVFFRAEYIAFIDWNKCSGCRNCVRVCQFGAVQYITQHGKCYIDPFKCYGCGVCRSQCKKEAIVLDDRVKYPGLKNYW